MAVIKYDTAVWHHRDDGETYTFPLGVGDAYGAEIYPLFNDVQWVFKGTLPAGLTVTDVNPVTEQRVRCKLAGVTVNTAEWAIDL